jgi:hypothetical protein
MNVLLKVSMDVFQRKECNSSRLGVRSLGRASRVGPMVPEFAITTLTKGLSDLTFSATAERLSLEVMSPWIRHMDLLT